MAIVKKSKTRTSPRIQHSRRELNAGPSPDLLGQPLCLKPTYPFQADQGHSQKLFISVIRKARHAADNARAVQTKVRVPVLGPAAALKEPSITTARPEENADHGQCEYKNLDMHNHDPQLILQQSRVNSGNEFQQNHIKCDVRKHRAWDSIYQNMSINKNMSIPTGFEPEPGLVPTPIQITPWTADLPHCAHPILGHVRSSPLLLPGSSLPNISPYTMSGGQQAAWPAIQHRAVTSDNVVQPQHVTVLRPVALRPLPTKLLQQLMVPPLPPPTAGLPPTAWAPPPPMTKTVAAATTASLLRAVLTPWHSQPDSQPPTWLLAAAAATIL